MSESLQELIARMTQDSLMVVQQEELEEFGRILSPEERAEHMHEKSEKEQAENDARKKAEKEEHQRVWMKARMDTVPTRYKESTFETYKNDALKASKSFKLLLEGSNAIIYGGFGCGKTHIGWALCKHMWSKGIDAAFTTAKKIFDSVKAGYVDGTSDDVVSKLKTQQYLIIDEADKTFGSQMEFVTLFDVINDRYNWCLPTVIMTNAKSADELPDVVGGANCDRLGSAGIVIHLTQRSWRANEKKIYEEVF